MNREGGSMRLREQVWLTSKDPDRMLRAWRGSVSERKQRLFAVACCRRLWPLMQDERSRRAVVVAERHADDLAGVAELTAARSGAREAVTEWQQQSLRDRRAGAAVLSALGAALLATMPRPARAARHAARAAGRAKAAATRARQRSRV